MIVLSKNLCRGNGFEFIVINFISAVGIEKPLSVFVCAEIEGKCPRAPEEVYVSIAYASVSKVNKTGELPIVEHYVGKTVISVE